MNTFSKDFLFGAATSAYQVEGATREDGRGPSCPLATLLQAEPSSEEKGLGALRELKIESGSIHSLERDDKPTMTIDGRTAENVPPRTVLKILLNPAKGSNIDVEIWLPDAGQWNGRLIGVGNGGPAGSIGAGTLFPYCSKGFAAVTTDMGTAPNPDSGVGAPDVWKDFGFRATHLMTVVAKQVIKAYYGKDPEYSFFIGGSTGGQQGLQEAQRYPEDYDGIVADIPAHCRTPLHAYFLWNDQILKKCAFTPAQEAGIQHAGIDYMTSRQMPALAGKCVADPRCTSKDIDGVIKLARQKDPTLNDAQAEGLYKLFDGPRHAVTDERIFCGIPFGSSFDSAHGNLYLFAWAFAGRKTTDEINFAEDIDTYTRVLGPYLNAENPDLGPFERRGGKMITVSGAADSVVPYHATLDYYERVIEHFGDLEKVRSFYRFYIVPGMGHGGQATGLGPPPDPLQMVMDWREKGTVPNAVICKRVVNGTTEIETPIYPYPQQTIWNVKTNAYEPVDAPRGGAERVASRFRPAPAE
jgi:feruloyl esterase